MFCQGKKREESEESTEHDSPKGQAVFHILDHLVISAFFKPQLHNPAFWLPVLGFVFVDRGKMQLSGSFISAISQIIRQPEQRSLSVAPSPCRATQHVSETAPVEGAEITKKLWKSWPAMAAPNSAMMLATDASLCQASSPFRCEMTIRESVQIGFRVLWRWTKGNSHSDPYAKKGKHSFIFGT